MRPEGLCCHCMPCMCAKHASARRHSCVPLHVPNADCLQSSSLLIEHAYALQHHKHRIRPIHLYRSGPVLFTVQRLEVWLLGVGENHSVICTYCCCCACVQILALANLRHKSTHSAQTVLSHFRREGSSQTWLPKQAAVQTKVGRTQCVSQVWRDTQWRSVCGAG